MNGSKRFILGALATIGLTFASGDAAYAQHGGCGSHGSGGSHSGHRKGSTSQSDDAVRATISDGVQIVRISVSESGYTPSRIVVKEDVPVRLVFEQFSSSACAAQVQIPSLGVPRITLKAGKETPVEFTPTKAGTYEFTCGMEMLTGTLVVESSDGR
jgi:heme/copper-type cytochrome/quinol oxidase subunit 2